MKTPDTLKGLAGVKAPMVKAARANSVTAFLNAIRKTRAVSGANDNGAITVWRDDAGDIRAAFCQYKVDVATGTFKNTSDLRKWLKVWFPKTYNA